MSHSRAHPTNRAITHNSRHFSVEIPYNGQPMLIPFEQLSPDALSGLIEDFVTRNGTDYGDIEVSLETKIKQVMRQLKSGEVVIAYNQDEEYCNIITREDAGAILDR